MPDPVRPGAAGAIGARAGTWWQGLSGNARGAIWLIPNALSFTVSVAIIKLVGATLPAIEIVFFAKLFQLVLLSPLMVASRPVPFRERRLGMLVFMVALMLVSMVSGFYAVIVMPIADATAISFTKSLFMVVLAVVLLRELVGVRRWAATLVGFAGAIVMIRPDASGIEPAALAAFLSAAAAAGSTIVLRSLAQTESSLSILVFTCVIGIAVLAVPVAFVWVTPSWWELALLACMGLMSAFGQWSLVRGYRLGEASALAPVEYTKLVFAGIAGYFVFAEVPTVWTVAGASLIVGSTFYTIRREARLKKVATPPSTSIG